MVRPIYDVCSSVAPTLNPMTGMAGESISTTSPGRDASAAVTERGTACRETEPAYNAW
jgi:hypothetical protein